VQAVLAPWRLPARVSRAVALDDGAHTLLAGGLYPGDHSSDQVLAVDPVHGSTRVAGRLAEAAHDSAGAMLAGRPYLFGGGGATELATVQRGGSRTWQVVGRLPGGTRSDLSVVDLGDALLLLGGYDGSRTPTTMLRTTDGTHFSTLGRLPAGVRYAGVARTGSTVWVLGGEVGQQELNEVYRVDTATGRVQSVGRLPGPLGHEAVVPVGRRLLVLGGRTAVHRTTDAMWWFDTVTHRWSRAGRLPEPVADAALVVRSDRAWLLGGEAPDFTDAVVEISWH
jgi:N-acetylneuraminic acid mutarotase